MFSCVCIETDGAKSFLKIVAYESSKRAEANDDDMGLQGGVSKVTQEDFKLLTEAVFLACTPLSRGQPHVDVNGIQVDISSTMSPVRLLLADALFKSCVTSGARGDDVRRWEFLNLSPFSTGERVGSSFGGQSDMDVEGIQVVSSK